MGGRTESDYGHRNHRTKSRHDPGLRDRRHRRAGDRHQGRAVRRRAGQDRADRRLRGRAARPGRRDAGQGEQADGRPLQEGQRAGDARPSRSEDRGRAATRSRPAIRCSSNIFTAGDRVDVIAHQPRQGLPGRHEAPPLRRRRGDARLDVPSRARIDRRVVVSRRASSRACARPAGWAAIA